MTDGLYFLFENDVPDGMTYLHDNIPNRLELLLQYFDVIYVSGPYHHIQLPQHPDGTIPQLRMRHKPPMYPPSVSNVHNMPLQGRSRTNNVCEGWNHAFSKLVGHAHPTIWRATDSIRMYHAQVTTELLRDEYGEPPCKHTRRYTVQLQMKLQNLCTVMMVPSLFLTY